VAITSAATAETDSQRAKRLAEKAPVALVESRLAATLVAVKAVAAEPAEILAAA